jgi:Tfp pilus assembly protein PilN
VSQQINLFNPIFLKKKKHFSTVTMAQGLGLIMLGSVAVFVVANLQLNAVMGNAEATSRQLAATKAKLEKVTAAYQPRQKSKALEEQVQHAEVELKSQRNAYDFVRRGGIGDTQGYSEYLRAFSRQIGGNIWLTGFSIEGPGAEIELRGRALDAEQVPAYINRLKRESIMQGKSFATLAMETPYMEIDASSRGKAEQNATTGYPEKKLAPFVEFRLKSLEIGKAGNAGNASNADAVLTRTAAGANEVARSLGGTAPPAELARGPEGLPGPAELARSLAETAGAKSK